MLSDVIHQYQYETLNTFSVHKIVSDVNLYSAIVIKKRSNKLYELLRLGKQK